MEENNKREENGMTLDKNSQINLVLNRPATDAVTIDLVRVFQNMKVKSRIYAWVLILCMLVGLSAPLLLYQFNQPMLTVSSVVTLNYDTPVRVQDEETEEWYIPESPEYEPVHDLTAPNGDELDLTQITSAYVLQNALNGLNLSYTPSVSNLRDNITVERILTQESYQNQVLLNQMVENKSAEMYAQYQQTEVVYSNRFIVSLANGFGDVDSRVRHTVTDEELKSLLNRIMTAYNDYLVRTYADMKLPEDRLAVIDVENLDVLENLESLRAASQELYNYCSGQPEAVRQYRSWRDGQNLEDWMRYIQNNQETSIDYLYSYVYSSRYTQDKDTLIAGYQYQLREAQAKLDTANENIAYIAGILNAYKNDEILLPATSEEENAQITTAQATTAYYNGLYLQQMENYETVEKLEVEISELQDKIVNLASGESAQEISQEAITAEMNQAVETFRSIYDQVAAHMEEIQSSGFYSLYAQHTEAQGKLDGFLASNMKKMLIGAAVGALVALVIWFLAALAPEFRRNHDEHQMKNEKEAVKA